MSACMSAEAPPEIFLFSPLVANDNAPDYALRPAFLSTFALATDQGSKLGLSKNKSIICYYNTYQVLYIKTHTHDLLLMDIFTDCNDVLPQLSTLHI